MNRTKISFLSITYNQEKYISNFINSVLNQSFQDFELIIVDDYSTDNTGKIVEEFKDERIKYIKHEFNKGINCAVNTAFENSKGEYLAFWACDDLPEIDYAKEVYSCFENNNDVGVFYPSLQPMSSNGKIIDDTENIYLRKYEDKWDCLKKLFIAGNCLFSPGMALRRDVFEKVYPLNASLIMAQDYQLHIKYLLLTNPYFTEKRLVRYRKPDETSGISYNNFAALKRLDLEQEMLMNTFLGIKDVQILKNIFGDELNKFGEPATETIPYFLSMLALGSNSVTKKDWGYRTLMNYISDYKNYELLNKLYGFCFKDYLNLIDRFYDAPIKKEKHFFGLVQSEDNGNRKRYYLKLGSKRV